MSDPSDIARITDLLELYRLQDAIEARIAELSREPGTPKPIRR